MSEEGLSVHQAYRAMLAFLAKEREFTRKPYELGTLVDSISTLADGSTADPAVWDQWFEAVRATN